MKIFLSFELSNIISIPFINVCLFVCLVWFYMSKSTTMIMSGWMVISPNHTNVNNIYEQDKFQAQLSSE